MGYPDAAWERAMTVREVMWKAVSGELHWFQAADILGWSPRTLRRWRTRYEAHGYAGRVDKRLLRPSKRRVPPGEAVRSLVNNSGPVLHVHQCCCTPSPVRLYLKSSEDLVAVRIARWSSPPSTVPNEIGVQERSSQRRSRLGHSYAPRDPAEVSQNMNRISVIEDRL